MSAEPVEWSEPGHPMDRLRPEGGLTAADLDQLPELPEHTELIDGGLFFVSPQKRFHMRTLFLLEAALRGAVPTGLAVAREMSVVLDQRTRLEPDISLLDAEAADDDDATWFPVSAVRLAVEVVSPDSEQRDRERKPQLYAQAGVQHFWRVEESGGRPVVYVYELDPATSSYALTGIHHDQLTLTVPFALDVTLDLTGL